MSMTEKVDWINSSTLPPNTKNVLMVVKYQNGFRRVEIGYYQPDEQFKGYWSDNGRVNATHWKPMPELPDDN